MVKNNKAINKWERVIGLWNFGVALMLLVVGVCFRREAILTAFTAQGFADLPVPQLSVILLVETIVLVFIWIQATFSENAMLREHFPELAPPLPRSSRPIVAGLAILLGLLGYFSDQIVIYSAIFICVKFFEIWGLRVRNTRLKKALRQCRAEASPEDVRLKRWATIEEYYLKKPQTQLAVIILSLSSVAVILSLLGQAQTLQQLYIWLVSASYGIMIVSIAASEVVFGNWRQKRNLALQEEY